MPHPTLIALAILALAMLTTLNAAVLAHQPATNAPRVEYDIHLDNSAAQLVDLSVTARAVTTEHVDFTLPAWRPGRYVILDTAGTVRRASARAGDTPLPVTKIDKHTWRVTTLGQPDITLDYQVYASSLADRTRHADDTHAFLSPASVCMLLPDRRAEPHRVRVHLPIDVDGWRVATGLEPDPQANPNPDNPTVFLAQNYDVLADSPLEIGLHDRITFDVDATPHELVIWGPGLYDRDALARDFAAIATAQRDLFGAFPYTRYLFILHLTPSASGGTEHLNSTIMQTNRANLEKPDAYRRFLGLVSHELFHTWNVKQFRPRDLSPYDYARENYTRLLWLVEGTTSYYDDLILARAGLLTPDDYLKTLGATAESVLRRPGNDLQSLEDSSFDAWIKFNRPNPDATNSTVDFYSKGALVSLALDLELRRRTSDRASLDDLMRALNDRFPYASPGYTPDDVIALASDIAGADLSPFFTDHIRGTAHPDLATLLLHVGLELIDKPKDDDKPADDAPAPHAHHATPRASLGLNLEDRAGAPVVTSVPSDGPAFAAGIIAGDELLAIDSVRVRTKDLDAHRRRLTPGQPVRLTIARHDHIRTLTLIPADRPDSAWTIRRVKQPTDAQKAAYRAWLHRDWPADKPAATPAEADPTKPTNTKPDPHAAPASTPPATSTPRRP